MQTRPFDPEDETDARALADELDGVRAGELDYYLDTLHERGEL